MEKIRHLLLYEYNNGKNATEATNNVHRHNVVSKSTAYRYYDSFRKGNESLQDLPRSEKCPVFSTRSVANKVGCSQDAV